MVDSLKNAAGNVAMKAAGAAGIMPKSSVKKLDKSGMCPSYKTIMVCGLLGSGKSTTISSMVGREVAPSAMSAGGCT